MVNSVSKKVFSILFSKILQIQTILILKLLIKLKSYYYANMFEILTISLLLEKNLEQVKHQ